MTLNLVTNMYRIAIFNNYNLRKAPFKLVNLLYS